MPDSAITKAGGRKFTFSVLTVLTNVLLVSIGIISISVYQTIVISVITGYLVSNVTQKIFTPKE